MKKVDNKAFEILPVRLMISLGILIIISVFFTIGISNYLIMNTETQMKSQCDQLLSQLYSLKTNGIPRNLSSPHQIEGSKRSIDFYIPDNLNFIAFGVNPSFDKNGELSSGLDENGEVICYQVKNSDKQIIWLKNDIFIREGEKKNGTWSINENGEGFIIDSIGEMTLTFELVKDNQGEYILIHANDNIDA